MKRIFISHLDDALALSKLGFKVHNLRGVGLDDSWVCARFSVLSELGKVSKQLDAWHFKF